jgi:uncharacterized protein
VALAMQKVGDFYLNGPAPLLKDPVAAAGWYAHSADAGLPEGYLSQGFVLENGLGKDKDNRFFEAADNYMKAEDSASASDQVRLAAFVRLGSLCYRGVLGSKSEAKPDYDKAYIYFQQAVNIDPKSQVALQLRDEAIKKIDPSKKASLDEEIVKAKQGRDARIKKQQEAADGKTSGAAPVAEPVTEPVAPVKPVKKPKKTTN